MSGHLVLYNQWNCCHLEYHGHQTGKVSEYETGKVSEYETGKVSEYETGNVWEYWKQ